MYNTGTIKDIAYYPTCEHRAPGSPQAVMAELFEDYHAPFLTQILYFVTNIYKYFKEKIPMITNTVVFSNCIHCHYTQISGSWSKIVVDTGPKEF